MLNFFFPNLIISILLASIIFILLFSVDSLINKITGLHVTKNKLIMCISFLILGVLAVADPLLFPIKFILSLISFCIFIFGFCINRKYMYILVSVLLIGSFVLIINGLNKYADYVAELFYLLLGLIILKELFYEKIFK